MFNAQAKFIIKLVNLKIYNTKKPKLYLQNDILSKKALL